MTLQDAIDARYARQAAEQAAARKTRKPGDPHPKSLYAGVEATMHRRRPELTWPTPDGSEGITL